MQEHPANHPRACPVCGNTNLQESQRQHVARNDRTQHPPQTQEQFRYDDQTITRLERSLSIERLGPYLELADTNRTYALQLYEWNTNISEALYGILQGFEVTLRNAIHETLSEAYARDDWYEVAPLRATEQLRIAEAKKRIADDGDQASPGRVISELMFAFWTSLVGTDYAQTLWDKHLYKALREHPTGRKEVAKRVKKVRFLRNRVAHHESVIGRAGQERDLRKDVREILEATSWICQTTAQWIAHNSSFDANYSRRPSPPQPELPLAPGA
jgi:hypothetical protein